MSAPGSSNQVPSWTANTFRNYAISTFGETAERMRNSGFDIASLDPGTRQAIAEQTFHVARSYWLERHDPSAATSNTDRQTRESFHQDAVTTVLDDNLVNSMLEAANGTTATVAGGTPAMAPNTVQGAQCESEGIKDNIESEDPAEPYVGESRRIAQPSGRWARARAARQAGDGQ
ncbi:hypothetical protein IAT40_002113 [Kwoniella sp. CBS 6097]